MKKIKTFESFSDFYSVNEALNKDIKQFEQDVANRLKKSGFKVYLLNSDLTTDQRKNIASDSKTIAIFATADNFAQTLYLSSNPKAENEVQKVLSNFQLASYKGKEQKTADGWKSKQVIGALNPGDIYLYNKEEVDGTIQRTYIRTRSVKSQTTTTEMGGNMRLYTTKTKGVEKGL